jgi:hypothetical protein
VAEKIAELAIMNAQSRLKTGKKVVRKKIVNKTGGSCHLYIDLVKEIYFIVRRSMMKKFF